MGPCFSRAFMIGAVLPLLLVGATAQGPSAGPGMGADPDLRARYEAVLGRQPFHETAFDQVYDAYLVSDGVDAWVARLEERAQELGLCAEIILARIDARQFRSKQALEHLKRAEDAGATGTEFFELLGTLRYEAADYEGARDALTRALEQANDPETLRALCDTLGNVYLRLGRRDEALATWQRLVERAPEDTFLLEDLAAIYESNRLWEEAAGVYEKLVELAKDDSYARCRALRRLGDARRHTENADGAIAAYEQALEIASPASWLFHDVKQRLVDTYEDLGQLDALITYLRERIDQAPADMEWQSLIAEAYTRSKQYDLAAESLRDVLARDPGNAAVHERLIEIYTQAGLHQEAIAACEELIASNPLEPDFLRRLGELHLVQGDAEAAKAGWRRVLQNEDAAEYALLGSWLDQYEFAEEAIAAYESAVDKKPDRDWVLRLAELKHDIGREDDAVALWLSLVTSETPAAECAEIAALLSAHEHDADAEPLLVKAHELAPDNLEFTLNLARFLTRHERHDESLPLYGALAAQDTQGHFKTRGEDGLFDAWAALGQLEAKETEWKAQLEANSGTVSARALLARLNLRRGDAVAAAEQLQAYLAEAPEDERFIKDLAAAYLRMNALDKAVALYEQRIARDPVRAGGYYRDLLDLYLRRGDKEASIAAAQKLVEWSPNDAQHRIKLAEIYQRFEEPDKALAECRKAIQIEPAEYAHYRTYGGMLSQQQRWGEASDAYRRMLDAATSDQVRLEAVRALAQIHLQQNRVAELIRDFEQRVRATPKKLSAYEELAAIHQATGNPRASLETVERALELVEDRASALRSVQRAAYDAGDLEKVIGTFEELIALSGAPGLFELERLGRTYFQLGKFDEAMAAWERMLDVARDDVNTYVAYSRVVTDAGLPEKALPALEKALEIDRYNFGLRFQYAQLLGQLEQVPAAIAQLQLILDLGPGEELPPEAAQSQQSSAQPMPGMQYQISGFPGYQAQFTRIHHHGGHFSFGYWPARGGAQAFQEFRPQVFQALIEFARRENRVDEIVAAFRQKAEDDLKNLALQNDLLQLCQLAGLTEQALAVAERLYAAQPEDDAKGAQVASLYAQAERLDDAIALYEKLAARNSDARRQYGLTIMHLYNRQGNAEARDALLASLRHEFPDDANVLLQAANILGSDNQWDSAMELIATVESIDRRQAQGLRDNLAHQARRQGATEVARRLWHDVAFGAPTSQAPNRPPSATGIYVYQRNQQFGGGQRQFQPYVAGLQLTVDYTRINALNQLYTMSLDPADFAPVAEELKGFAATALTGENGPDAAGIEAVKLYLLYLLNEARLDDASAFLGEIQRAAVHDGELDNLELYLLGAAKNFNALEEKYEAAEAAFPAQAQNIATARINIMLEQKDFEAVDAAILGQIRDGGSPGHVGGFIHQYAQAHEGERLAAIGEALLQHGRRQPDNVITAAQCFAYAGRHDEAIELAREAWEAAMPASMMMASSSVGYAGRRGGNQEQLLAQVSQVYQMAQRGDELLREFEERAEKHPQSQVLYACLRFLYNQTGRSEKALAVMQRLVEARPNDYRLKMEYAEQLRSQNRQDEALTIFEELATQNPRAFDYGQHMIMDLYNQEQYRDRVSALIERLANATTDPRRLGNLAQELAGRGAHEQAVDMFERVIAVDPTAGHYRYSLAQSLFALEREEEAVKEATLYLQSNMQHRTSNLDSLTPLISIFDKAGQLDALRSLAQDRAGSNPSFVTLVDAAIARSEGRNAEALELLERMYEERGDNSLLPSLFDLSRAQEAWGKAARYLELQFQANGHVNGDELGEMYFKAGDADRAVLAWRRMGEDYGGAHGAREVLKRLIDRELWEPAQAYYEDNKARIVGDRWAAQEVFSILLDAYLQHGHFEFVRDALLDLDAEQLEGALNNVIHRGDGNRKKAEVFVLELLEQSPDSVPLLKAAAQITERSDNGAAKAKELRARVYELEPGDEQSRMQYAYALQRSGDSDTAIKLLDIWAREYPMADSTRVIADYVANSANASEVIRVRDLVLPLLPEEQAIAVAARLAPAVARAGDYDWALQSLQTAMERQPNEENYNRLVTLLLEHENDEAAFNLYQTYDQTYGGRSRRIDLLAPLFVRLGEAEALADLLWNLGESTHVYEYVNYVDNMMHVMEHSRSVGILTPLRARLSERDEVSPGHMALLATIEAAMGRTEAALRIVDDLCGQYPETCGNYNIRQIFYWQFAQDDPTFSAGKTKDIQMAQQQVYRLMAENKTAEAEALVTEILSYDASELGVQERELENAKIQLCFQVGRYQDALSALEKLSEEGVSGYRATQLATAHAGVGNLDKAMELFQKHRNESDFGAFGQHLVKQGHFPQAIEVLTMVSEDRGQEYVAQLAEAHLKGGTGVDYREVFREVAEESGIDHIVYTYTTFLSNQKLLADAAATANLREDPLLVRALAMALSNMGDEEAGAVSGLREALEASADISPHSAESLAGYLDRIGDAAAAAKWFVILADHPDTQPHARDAACQRLIRLECPLEVVWPGLDRAVRRDPGILTRVHDLFSFMLERDRDAFLALLATVPEHHQDAPRTQLQQLAFLVVSDDGAARDQLVEAACAVSLPEAVHRMLVLHLAKKQDPALVDASRAYAERWPTSAFARDAWKNVFTSSLRDQELDVAVLAVRHLLPIYGGELEAIHEPLCQLALEPATQMRQKLHALVQESPNNPRAPQLLLLCADIAAQHGETEDPAALGRELGMSEVNAHIMDIWAGMIEHWQVAGMEALSPDAATMDSAVPEVLAGSLTPEASLPEVLSGWKPVVPESTFGIVVMNEALGLEEGDDYSHKIGYAVTEIVSPDARTVRFAHGSDDWVCIWLNGTLIHENYKARSTYIDMDMLECQLLPGRNRVVVKVGNSHGDWEFSLSVIEGAEGLAFEMPAAD